jgi:predicted GTPase
MKEAHIVVRIEQRTLKQLQKMAKDQDLSVSWLIRKAIHRLITEAENVGKSLDTKVSRSVVTAVMLSQARINLPARSLTRSWGV